MRANCLQAGLGLLVLAFVGLAAGALVFVYGFVALVWEFPRTWQPLSGLPDTPRQLLALRPSDQSILLRTDSGQLVTCLGQACTTAAADWSTPDSRCEASDQPASVALFPLLLFRNFHVVLACEQDYQSTLRTVYVVAVPEAGAWRTGGPGIIPTDAAVIGVGLLGGLIGLVAALLVGGLIIAARWWAGRARAAALPSAR